MIVLHFPDGSERQLKDEQARRLVALLVEMAPSEYAATVAAALHHELRYGVQSVRKVDVPPRNAPRVAEALSRLS